MATKKKSAEAREIAAERREIDRRRDMERRQQRAAKVAAR